MSRLKAAIFVVFTLGVAAATFLYLEHHSPWPERLTPAGNALMRIEAALYQYYGEHEAWPASLEDLVGFGFNNWEGRRSFDRSMLGRDGLDVAYGYRPDFAQAGASLPTDRVVVAYELHPGEEGDHHVLYQNGEVRRTRTAELEAQLADMDARRRPPAPSTAATTATPPSSPATASTAR